VTCAAGYTLVEGSSDHCDDVDECATNNGGCHANATCTNTPGSWTCGCQDGYAGDGRICVEVVRKSLAGETFEFSRIPEGTFWMGAQKTNPSSVNYDSMAEAHEGPVHQVTISRPYLMGRTEVTQAQWLAVMGSNPSYFQGPSEPDAPLRPVEQVSWVDALSFMNKLSDAEGITSAYALSGSVSWSSPTTGYRLPTESEWEYAARAGSSASDYEDGSWSARNSNNQTHPVGLRKPNGWGLFDILGNVAELVWDSSEIFVTYQAGPATDPKGPSSAFCRIKRGGDWDSSRWNRDLSFSQRDYSYPANAYSNKMGLRIVRSLP
jgi:formylglycine-generating enzyme required for sulfatase activity